MHITNIRRYGFAFVEPSEWIRLLEYVQKSNPILYIYFISILLFSHRFWRPNHPTQLTWDALTTLAASHFPSAVRASP